MNLRVNTPSSPTERFTDVYASHGDGCLHIYRLSKPWGFWAHSDRLTVKLYAPGTWLTVEVIS